ncbi:hypothetical protein Acsp04_08040 [Actinomadura sp. NBRC 104425]|nr:hypothetical protein Acsp04_08040 [Actinomadura sp. NBRC 104425]
MPARTIPGCRSLEAAGEDVYAMTVSAGVASVRGTYAGRVELTDPDPPRAFTPRARGHAPAAGPVPQPVPQPVAPGPMLAAFLAGGAVALAGVAAGLAAARRGAPPPRRVTSRRPGRPRRSGSRRA